jgi:tRNA threonylcarbamoyladenosine biosynthesis protein TsaE
LEKTIITRTESETVQAGFEFAADLNYGDIIGLEGELGTGKTQFVKGICRYFKVKDIVNSPTFIIVNEYTGSKQSEDKPIRIYHFDLYRLEKPYELEIIGFDEYVNQQDSVILIEWPSLAEEYLGRKVRKVRFEYGNKENSRVIKV